MEMIEQSTDEQSTRTRLATAEHRVHAAKSSLDALGRMYASATERLHELEAEMNKVPSTERVLAHSRAVEERKSLEVRLLDAQEGLAAAERAATPFREAVGDLEKVRLKVARERVEVAIVSTLRAVVGLMVEVRELRRAVEQIDPIERALRRLGLGINCPREVDLSRAFEVLRCAGGMKPHCLASSSILAAVKNEIQERLGEGAPGLTELAASLRPRVS